MEGELWSIHAVFYHIVYILVFSFVAKCQLPEKFTS